MLHIWVKTLNTHFKLQRACRKLCNEFFQAVMQAVGYDFKMDKQLWRDAVKKKLQNANRKIDLQIKRAVYKLKVARTALVQLVHLSHEGV